MATAEESTVAAGVVYELTGTLIEACSCGVNCPCWIGEDPDLGECFAIVAYGIDDGTIEELDVSGLNLVLVCHIPGNVLAGNWEIVALVDERGTEEYNLALGERRGEAVRKYLIDLGIPASRLRVVSFGEAKPAVVRRTPDRKRLAVKDRPRNSRARAAKRCRRHP